MCRHCNEAGSPERAAGERQRQSWVASVLPVRQGPVIPGTASRPLHVCCLAQAQGAGGAPPALPSPTTGISGPSDEQWAQRPSLPAHEFFMPLFEEWETGGLPLSSAVKP